MVIYLNPFIMPIVFRFNNISFHFHSSFAAFLSLLLQNTPLCFHYEIKVYSILKRIFSLKGHGYLYLFERKKCR